MVSDAAFDAAIERDPFIISSQWKAGHILSEEDIGHVEKMYQEWSNEVDSSGQAYISGYESALRDMGGEQLVKAHQKKEAEKFDRILKKALAKSKLINP